MPEVVKKEQDQFAVRKLACSGLVQALDAAFVSAGQQDLPVSEYFKANSALLDLCKEIFNLSQEVWSFFFFLQKIIVVVDARQSSLFFPLSSLLSLRLGLTGL